MVFKLRALPYGKVKSIRDSVAGDPGLDILLAGCVEPDLKAKELKEKYGGESIFVMCGTSRVWSLGPYQA